MNLPRHMRVCRFLTLVFSCLISFSTQADFEANKSTVNAINNIEDLLSADRLQVRSWLTPTTNIVPGQQIKLNIEIATDRWFTGGTRIKIPEIPGLVILQTDDFASNSSEQRKGQSWVVQRWALEIYAQAAGGFAIPPITATVKVGSNSGQNIVGEVRTAALTFSAAMPDALSRAVHWVAAPSYSASQTFNTSLEELAVGDAIERKIEFRAAEVMAMMLPAFNEEDIEGLAAYADPPVLNNSSNRGSLVASRIQRIIYIAETPGKYRLAAQDFYWWDTTAGEVQLLTLPSVDIIVVASGAQAQKTKEGPTLIFRSVALWFAGLLLAVTLVWIMAKIPFAAIANSAQVISNSLLQQWRKFRQPALPGKLNPGNSAEQ